MLGTRRCENCEKRRGGHCTVLSEMIGRHGDCWAFSDDVDWEIKVAAAVAEYKRMLEEKAEVDDVHRLLIEDIRRKTLARPRRKSKDWYSPKFKEV